MNTSNSNKISVKVMDGREIIAERITLASLMFAFLGLVICLISPVRAEDLRSNEKQNSDAIQIVTSALGLERLTKYSANPRAVGYAWANAVGVEASYYDMGDSKFAKGRVLDNGTTEDIGRRVDMKLAVDLSTPVADGTRVYSRLGMYLWDVDFNYNRASRDFNSSGNGNSSLMGVGAMFAVDGGRLSFEYERLAFNQTSENRDPQRILLHVSSKF